MTHSSLLLGLDVGTTRVKAVVFDLSGQVVASARRATCWSSDADGTAMDAVELRSLILDVAGEAATAAVSASGGCVTGIGTTGMGEAGVLAGPDDEPMGPVRAWYDERGDVETIRRSIGAHAFHEATGMPLTAQPSLAKVLHQITESPAAAGAVRFYSVPEWAARCLGSRPVSELSLASRTGLLDVVTGLPWDGAHQLLGKNLLNELVSAGTDVGRARGDVPPVLRGAILTVAGHDHQVAALAAGAAVDGALFDSLGTAEALLRFTAGPLDRHVVASLAAQRITAGRAVVPGHWCVLHGLLTGFALERLAALLGATDERALVRLGEQALTAPPSRVRVQMGTDGMRITLPVEGAGSYEVTPAAVWAAAVEAAAQASGVAVRAVAEMIGEHRTVIAAGGWLTNPAVLAAKLRQFCGLVTSSAAESGAAGAAYLAGVASGDLAGATTPWPPPAQAQPTGQLAMTPPAPASLEEGRLHMPDTRYDVLTGRRREEERSR